MSTTLYRKYRPQIFADVIGQDHIINTLQNQVVSRKLAHAYLFCGTRGVGKTTVARLLAKSLNCRDRKAESAEPCNNCASCQAITLNRSLDLIEIDAASNRRIDDVREIREHIPYGPTENAYKVIIIDEVHMLTTEAFNALLKTLEEPPPHVVFILATTEVHKLPDTIKSRCQRYDFRPISTKLLEQRLELLAKAEGVKIDKPVLLDIAHLARGSTRDAESYLGKLIGLGSKSINYEQASLALPKFDTLLCLQFIGLIINYDAGAAVQIINSYLNEGGELSHFHSQVLELLRQLLLCKVSGSTTLDFYGSSESSLQLIELARKITQARAQMLIERWLSATDGWRDTDIPQLPLELAAIEMAMREADSAKSSNPQKTIAQVKSTQTSSVVSNELGDNNLNLLPIIQEKWMDIVAKLRDFNHSLSFILSIARPILVEGNTLTIAFQYQLHLDRVNDAKVREALSKALQDITGKSMLVRGKLEAPSAGGDLLTNVLNTFGGEVVN